uniref:Replicase n=1 Tax=Ligustrum virus A TaxID=1899566 RepID=A0A8F4Q3R3_9VIRU|nr:replicase [Ligustrum virus A]
MALTYRSPMEEIVTCYESSVQSSIASASANFYKEVEAGNFQLFNYHLSPEAKRKLSIAGIYLSPFSAMPHSHPACKTLENYILYKVLPSYLDNRFFFVGIKQFKLELLKKRDPNLDLITSINRYVTSADKSRYGSDFVRLSSPEVLGLKRHASCLADSTLRDLAPALAARKGKYVFLHDEIHYWTTRDLLTFLEVLAPEQVLATMVYPPELLVGATSSLHSWCYTFDVQGKTLYFYPDGVRSEGYEQPVQGGFLLRTKKLHLPDGTTYCVDLLHSKFAHHLVSITRGDSCTPKARSFGPFEATGCKSLSLLTTTPNCFIPVAFEVVSRLYRYLRSLKKPDQQSAMAKLSQLLPEPTGTEIKFTHDFAKLVMKTGEVESMLGTQHLKLWMGKWLSRLPNVLARQFTLAKEVALDSFISELAPFCFTIKLEDVNWTTQYLQELLEPVDYEEDVDLVQELDRLYDGGKSPEWDRQRTPYSLLLSLTNQRQSILALNAASFSKGLAQVYTKMCTSDCTRRISRFEVHSVLSNLILDGSHLLPKAACLRELAKSEYFDAIVRKIVALVTQKVRLYFHEIGILWFRSNFRGFTNYIGMQGESGTTFKDLHKSYQSAVVDFFRFGVIPPLKKCRYVHDVSYNRVSPLTTEQREQVSEPIDVPVQEEQPLIVRDIGSANCSCGIIFQIDSLVYQDHNFIATDNLRGRRAGWYTRDCNVDYKYNGGSHISRGWPDWLRLWCEVNEVDLKYDSCLFQEYSFGASIGFHADDEPIFARGEEILTVNLCGTADFCIRGDGCNGVIELQGPAKFTMPHNFQESHKHSVRNCSERRQSVTFRVLKKEAEIILKIQEDCEIEIEPRAGFERSFCEIDVKISELDTEMEYKEVNVPGDGNCFWHCMGHALCIDATVLKKRALNVELDTPELCARLKEQGGFDCFAEDEAIMACAIESRTAIFVHCPEQDICVRYCPKVHKSRVQLMLVKEHFTLLLPKNGCVVEAIANAIGRNPTEVLHVINEQCDESITKEIWAGDGVSKLDLECLFTLFGIEAQLFEGSNVKVLNQGGRNHACFELEKDHISYSPRRKAVAALVLRDAGFSSRISDTQFEFLSNAGTQLFYLASKSRAELLSQCLLDGSTGIISSSLFDGKKNLLRNSEERQTVPRDVVGIFGTFGSGKSTMLKKFFKANPRKMITYISPRKALAEEFKKMLNLNVRNQQTRKKLGQEHWTVSTFEKFLQTAELTKSGCVLIFDEIQLYPPGYLDLVSYLVPADVRIVVAGDPCQSDYDSEKDRLFLGMIEADFKRLLTGASYSFVIQSKRFINPNFIDRLPCSFGNLGGTKDKEEYLMYDGVDGLTKIPEQFLEAILVSSFDEKKIVYSYIGQDCNVMTFGESTGLTFDYGTVIISSVSSMTSEQRWVTALSRFKKNICLVNLTNVLWSQLALDYRGKVLHKFLTGTASVTDLSAFLPGEPKFTHSYDLNVGKDEGVKEEKLAGDPWLKGMIFLGQAEDCEEIEEIATEVKEQWFKTHLPQADLEGVRATWVHKIMAKEMREVRLGYLVSDQFTDEHSKQLGKQLTNAAERFETIYPRHRANDTVTFIMAVKKRLRFSNPAKEMGKLGQAKLYGKFLLDEFLKKIPLKRQHDKVMMDAARQAFEDKKTSKSAATIENHSNRSCRDWLIDIGLIFSKSQLCTKFDNRFRVAKAAQSIVCFQHEVLCRFAPYMRYIEMKLHEVLPSNYYIHSGKGLEELNDWVLRGKFEGVCTESDYEAFDASQDQYIVAFEMAVMKYLGLPQSLINDYVFIKTHLGSKLGNFAIMRFSGEASTFLFNTMANMLFTFLRYEIKGNEFICFAGDDMCASRRLPIKKEHDGFLSKLKLKAKVAFTNKPTFCGWNLTPDGIYKKPQLVMERMCIAKETNNLANCIDNYAIEVSYAYRLGEKALNRMDEEEAAAMYNCVRIIIKNKHLLKSDVATLYTTKSGFSSLA